MGIFIETKEELLARSIDYAPAKSTHSGVVLSAEQKEMDFDEQVLASIGADQDLLRSAIIRCSAHLVEKSEKVIMEGAEPTNIDQLLRISFWEELSNALRENRKVSERNVYNGVCSVSYWNNLKTINDEKFTYLLIPVKSYSRTNQLLLTLGQEALITILNADPYVKSQGSGYKKIFDPRIAKVQLEAYKMVEERLYGKAVARIQTHSTSESSDNASDTIEMLQREIKALEGKPTTFSVEDESIE